MTDLELLARWRAGDGQAGRDLFERYYLPIYRFFRTKVDHGIEDLVQDTFAACVRGRERIGQDAGFRAYLYGTARNILRKSLRRAQVRGDVIDLEQHSVHDLGPSVSSIIAERAEQRLLLEGLRRLPIDYQLAFELYYWERLTASEMGQILGLSEAGVRSRLHRAKQQLHQTMTALADSPQLLQSTLTDLEGWAERLKATTSATARNEA